MSVSSIAAAKPPLKPFPSQFGDDSIRESDELLDLCAKTVIDVEVTVMAANSLISAINEALDAPLIGESEVCEFDWPFCLAVGSPGLVSDFYDSIVPETAFDDSIVPETAFDDPMEGFVPDSEDEGVEEAGGGDPMTSTGCSGDGGGGGSMES